MLKHHHQRIVSHLLGGIFVVAVSIIASVAYGVGDLSEEAQPAVKMRQEVYDGLMVVQSQITAADADEDTFVTALEAVKQLEDDFKSASLSDYEMAQLNNLSGYIHFLNSDYPNAIVSYKRVVALTNEVPVLQAASFKTIAQLHFTLEEYAQALAVLEQREKVIPGGPTPDDWVLIGQAYFLLEQYEPALDYFDLAVEQAESQGQVPKENWLLLQRTTYYELGDLEGMVPVLEKLIELYPKSSYKRTLKDLPREIQERRNS